MKKITQLLLTCSLISATAVQASDDNCFENAQTQAQLNGCAVEALNKADGDLNTLYHRMQERLKNDINTKAMMVEAQRKWLTFRDAECKFFSSRSAGGSMSTLQMDDCLTKLTRTRVMELQNHLACGRGSSEQEALQCALPPVGR